MSMEVDEQIVVVGAGIAGLATALGLHRLGLKCLVLESSPSLRAAGYAFTAWTNAWKALDELGVGDAVREQHNRLERLVTISTSIGVQTGEIAFTTTKTGMKHEVRCIRRKILLETMAKELPSGTIRFSSKMVSVEDSGGLKLVHLADGSMLKAKALIGCDGVNSAVAKWLGLQKPSFSGRSIIRGFNVFKEGHGFEPQLLQFIGEGIRYGIIPCDDSSIYWFVSFSALSQGVFGLQKRAEISTVEREKQIKVLKGGERGTEKEMEGSEEDVKVGANKFSERQPLGTSALTKDYKEPPPAPFFDPGELMSWSFYRAGIAEFMATFLFLYITILTVMGVNRSNNKCATVGIQGIAWAFGGMIFALVYCTAGISGGHINPAVTFGLLLARKLSLTRALFYMIMQCLGAICGAGVVKGFQPSPYELLGGGANVVNHGYSKGDGLGAEIVGTFVLVYTVFSATDAKRNARDSHVPILAPLPIGFAVFLVHLATIPITGTGINPARSLGAAIIYNKDHAWDDMWVFWVGPFIGAALAAIYHQIIIRAIPFKSSA